MVPAKQDARLVVIIKIKVVFFFSKSKVYKWEYARLWTDTNRLLFLLPPHGCTVIPYHIIVKGDSPFYPKVVGKFDQCMPIIE